MEWDFEPGTPVVPFAMDGLTDNIIVISVLDGVLAIIAQVTAKHVAGVFILVAFHTQILPVAPVRRIVLVVAVPVVDRQDMEVVLIEIPAAFRTEPSREFQATCAL